MASPLFTPLFNRKYIVQIRANISHPWRDYEAYRRLDQAEQAFKKLMQHQPTTQIRIFNRLTGRVMQSHPQKK